MTLQQAKMYFAVYMERLRDGVRLTQPERDRLNIARQMLRQQRKPIMNLREVPKSKGTCWCGKKATKVISGSKGPVAHVCPTCFKKYSDPKFITNPKRITIKQAQQLAKQYGHRIVNNRDWGEFIVKGPFFPTGYHTKDLEEAVETLLYEVKRHPKQDYMSNPRGVLIYGKVNRIIATKTQNHICDAECKRHGHRYYHDFTSMAKMYGLPDGSILIKA